MLAPSFQGGVQDTRVEKESPNRSPEPAVTGLGKSPQESLKAEGCPRVSEKERNSEQQSDEGG